MDVGGELLIWVNVGSGGQGPMTYKNILVTLKLHVETSK